MGSNITLKRESQEGSRSLFKFFFFLKQPSKKLEMTFKVSDGKK